MSPEDSTASETTPTNDLDYYLEKLGLRVYLAPGRDTPSDLKDLLKDTFDALQEVNDAE